eukprot:CAMPEP_0203686964 /NCGR_PEP_ID=MMETSP0090-20130426/49338_1 /ASSEMBLY_ACC=CAM_ASM_001088 /TAXON_ID=426623 /ORGANISM="Chaetoceros affinis, Strain CCMP159" /LENGTH=1061 /DNA_ID=CAMNT_0050556211 /DNA_START=130 /DNA_END=3315 /DNA_ORIENTATION=+
MNTNTDIATEAAVAANNDDGSSNDNAISSNNAGPTDNLIASVLPPPPPPPEVAAESLPVTPVVRTPKQNQNQNQRQQMKINANDDENDEQENANDKDNEDPYQEDTNDNDHDMESEHENSEGGGGGEGGEEGEGGCFFADAMLDLEDARCIEETPEMRSKQRLFLQDDEDGDNGDGSNHGDDDNNGNGGDIETETDGNNNGNKDKHKKNRKMRKMSKLQLPPPPPLDDNDRISSISSISSLSSLRRSALAAAAAVTTNTSAIIKNINDTVNVSTSLNANPIANDTENVISSHNVNNVQEGQKINYRGQSSSSIGNNTNHNQTQQQMNSNSDEMYINNNNHEDETFSTTAINGNTTSYNTHSSNNNHNTIRPQRIVNDISSRNNMQRLAPTTQPKPPRQARDTNYILFFLVSLPLLFLPCTGGNSSNNNNNNDNDSGKVQITHTAFPTILATAASFILIKIIYSTRGGDEGDDSRYNIGTILFLSNLITCLSMPILTLQVYYLNIGPGSFYGDANSNSAGGEDLFGYHTLVLGMVFASIREIYLFAKLFKSGTGRASPTANIIQSQSQIMNNANSINMNMNVSVVNLSETINDGKRTTFRMVLNVALDVLSRSLRPMNVIRFVVCIAILQFCTVQIVKSGCVCAYNVGGVYFMMVVGAVGYWAVFLLVKFVALVCSGGVTVWFAQQSLLMEEMERMRRSEEGDAGVDADIDGGVDEYYYNGNGNGSGGNNGEDDREEEDDDDGLLMPEAYRNVNANVYSSVIEFDEGMDDDFDDDDDDTLMDSERFDVNPTSISGGGRNRSGNGNGSSGRDWQNTTVKSFLAYGVTTSFGSVLQCALLGPISNLVDVCIYYVDWFLALIVLASNRRQGRNTNNTVGDGRRTGMGGFQGMAIVGNGDGSGNENFSYLSLKEKVRVLWKRLEHKARTFVKNNDDMALCHVAAYHKSYKRAANDVMTLLHASGTTPILRDDISSHMCSSVSKAVSIIVVIIIGQPLSLHSSGLKHSTVCEIMVVSYMMCFMILSTVMEPLRASIKAVLVSFAQHPQSLSQAFPLVYHRLSRISDD